MRRSGSLGGVENHTLQSPSSPESRCAPPVSGQPVVATGLIQIGLLAPIPDRSRRELELPIRSINVGLSRLWFRQTDTPDSYPGRDIRGGSLGDLLRPVLVLEAPRGRP